MTPRIGCAYAAQDALVRVVVHHLDIIGAVLHGLKDLEKQASTYREYQISETAHWELRFDPEDRVR